MRIFVKARPGAKEERIIAPSPRLLPESKKTEEKEWFTVWVKELPVQGKANLAIVKALANYFKVSNSQVQLVSGFSSKQKVFEIEK
jgi:uncharacterized protein YggU (UPF0235/DUF167 family)